MSSLRLTLAATALSLATLLSAQERTLFDDFPLEMTGAWGGWQYMFSDYAGQDGMMRGGYGGLEFNKIFFLGYGGMRLRDDISLPDGQTGNFNLRFHGPSIQYMPLARSIIHPKAGFQLGFGKASATGLPQDRIILLQPTLGAEINVLRWFRLSGEGGYRHAANWDLAMPESDYLNGFFAQLTLKFGFSWGDTSWDDDSSSRRGKRGKSGSGSKDAEPVRPSPPANQSSDL